MARSAGVQLEKVSEIAEKQTSPSISILVFSNDDRYFSDSE